MKHFLLALLLAATTSAQISVSPPPVSGTGSLTSGTSTFAPLTLSGSNTLMLSGSGTGTGAIVLATGGTTSGLVLNATTTLNGPLTYGTTAYTGTSATTITLTGSSPFYVITGTFAGTKNIVLPSAANYPNFGGLTLFNRASDRTNTNLLVVSTSGSDTINGALTSEQLETDWTPLNFIALSGSEWLQPIKSSKEGGSGKGTLAASVEHLLNISGRFPSGGIVYVDASGNAYAVSGSNGIVLTGSNVGLTGTVSLGNLTLTGSLPAIDGHLLTGLSSGTGTLVNGASASPFLIATVSGSTITINTSGTTGTGAVVGATNAILTSPSVNRLAVTVNSTAQPPLAGATSTNSGINFSGAQIGFVHDSFQYWNFQYAALKSETAFGTYYAGTSALANTAFFTWNGDTTAGMGRPATGKTSILGNGIDTLIAQTGGITITGTTSQTGQGAVVSGSNQLVLGVSGSQATITTPSGGFTSFTHSLPAVTGTSVVGGASMNILTGTGAVGNVAVSANTTGSIGTITVTGATDGDTVLPLGLPDAIYNDNNCYIFGRISGTNTITVYLLNNYSLTTSITPPTKNVRANVLHVIPSL